MFRDSDNVETLRREDFEHEEDYLHHKQVAECVRLLIKAANDYLKTLKGNVTYVHSVGMNAITNFWVFIAKMQYETIVNKKKFTETQWITYCRDRLDDCIESIQVSIQKVN